jgi:hypothetical protein
MAAFLNTFSTAARNPRGSSWRLSKLWARWKPLGSAGVPSPLHFLLDYPSRRMRFVRLPDFPDEVLEKLEPLDQEFFSYPHDLTGLLFAYVSEHPQEFGLLPKPDDV